MTLSTESLNITNTEDVIPRERNVDDLQMNRTRTTRIQTRECENTKITKLKNLMKITDISTSISLRF